mgnify:CR=1 FL=1
MFGARLATELQASLGRLVVGLVGWTCFAPWAALWRRRRDLVAVVGLNGQFVGNAKYFHLHLLTLAPAGMELVFLASDAETVAVLDSHRIHAH